MANTANKAHSKKQRVHSSLLTRILLVVLLVAVGWQLYGLRDQVASARAEQQLLAAQVANIQQENDALAADIAKGSTSEKMEELARDELGWVAPGEYVFYPSSN